MPYYLKCRGINDIHISQTTSIIKSLVALYSNKMFHVAGAKIIRDIKSGQNAKTEAKLPCRNEKGHKNTDSGFVQQPSLSMPAAREDLAPRFY